MIDVRDYDISVKKEVVEGEELYVARVAELKDVEDYAETYEDAFELVLDTISTCREMFLSMGLPFPEPNKTKGVLR